MSNFSRYFPFFIITLLVYGFFFYQKDNLSLQSEAHLSKKKIVQINVLNQDKNSTSLIVQEESAPTKKIAPLESKKVQEKQTELPLLVIEKTTKKEQLKQIKVSSSTVKKQEISEVMPPQEKEKADEAKLAKSVNTGIVKEPEIIEEKIPSAIIETETTTTILLDFTNTKAIDVASIKGHELDKMLYLHLDLPRRPFTKKKKQKKSAKTPKKVNPPKVTSQKVIPKSQKTNSITEQVLNQPAKQKRVFKRINKDRTPELSKQDNPRNLPEAIAITGNKPSYPEQARALNQKGTVVIQFIVTTRGETLNPSIMISSGNSELDRAVINFVIKERFMPALKDNEKISAEQIYSFTF